MLVHGDPPSEGELASWMQEGIGATLLVAEQGSNEPYTLLANFSLVISARVSARAGCAFLNPTRGPLSVTNN